MRNETSSIEGKRATPKRIRRRAIYLSDTERDLLISGMRVLRSSLYISGNATEKVADFAKSFTCRRIDDVIVLLLAVDNATEAAGGTQ